MSQALSIRQHHSGVIPGLASILVILGLLLGSTLIAADFPRLSGRVVDKAGMLDRSAEQRITDLLAGQ